jgi:hypothetical protein
MRHVKIRKAKETEKESRDAARESVRKEMAKPRMTKSARIAEQDLDTTRISEQSSASMPGTVVRIIPSTRRSGPEKAQIDIHGVDSPYRKLRIENSLTDENGDEVKLKKGAHVEVTVAADSET